MFKLPAHIKSGTPEAGDYMGTKRTKIEWTHIRRDVADFDAHDAKGRRHGYAVSIGTKTFTRTEIENYRALVDDENLGLWFTARPHALKDGKPFGALQGEKHFRTLAEADAAAAAMIERARKAAAKKK